MGTFWNAIFISKLDKWLKSFNYIALSHITLQFVLKVENLTLINGYLIALTLLTYVQVLEEYTRYSINHTENLSY